ncbi:hypothetical protein ACHAXN_000611 [Cyclotella atomus]
MMKRSYGTPAEVPTNVQVIAPATLSAGYTFEASYNSVTFPVTVPQGGVTEGQRFIVPFLPPTAVAKAVPMQSDAAIPTGAWRDSLWNCCAFGPCHSHFLNSWFCRSVLIGQLLTRMKMDWLGSLQRRNDGNDDAERNYHQGWRNSFRNLILLTVAFYLLMAVTTTPQTMDPSMQSSFQDQAKTNNDASQPDQYITYNDLSKVDKIKYNLNGCISALFSFYMVYILAKLRATTRRTYSIPEENCLCCYQLGVCGNNTRDGIECCGKIENREDGVPIGWEDVCCSIWCSMCVAAQMARHTVDYRERRGACCNSVGVYGWDEDEAYANCSLEGEGVGEGAVLVV